MTTSLEGTPLFHPPECCVFEEEKQREYSMKKADIWALGVTLYCMTYNKMPFPIHGTDIDVMDRIYKHRLDLDSEDRPVSSELKAFLSFLL